MLGWAVAGFLLHCLLNFSCHTSINLIVQNKWANFWSRRLCLQDKSGDLLTPPSFVEGSPSFGWDISSQNRGPFILLLWSPCGPPVVLLWSSPTAPAQTSLLSHPLPWNHALPIQTSQWALLPDGCTKRSVVSFLTALVSFWQLSDTSLRIEAPGCELAPCCEVTPSSSVGLVDHGDNGSHSWTLNRFLQQVHWCHTRSKILMKHHF